MKKMIINDNQKYIFVHIPKTGGCSVTSIIKNNHQKQYITHTTAKIVKNDIHNYDDYFSFAFVRNPWARLYGLYSFICQKNMNPKQGETWNQQEFTSKGFKWWLMKNEWWAPFDFGNKNLPPHQKRCQSVWIHDKSETIVNYVGKMETLKINMNYISKQLNINNEIVPHMNKSKHNNYKTIYDKEMIDFVYHHHKKIIDEFNYGFDE